MSSPDLHIYGDVIRILEAQGGLSGFENNSMKFIAGVKEEISKLPLAEDDSLLRYISKATAVIDSNDKSERNSLRYFLSCIEKLGGSEGWARFLDKKPHRKIEETRARFVKTSGQKPDPEHIFSQTTWPQGNLTCSFTVFFTPLYAHIEIDAPLNDTVMHLDAVQYCTGQDGGFAPQGNTNFCLEGSWVYLLDLGGATAVDCSATISISSSQISVDTVLLGCTEDDEPVYPEFSKSSADLNLKSVMNLYWTDVFCTWNLVGP